MSKRRNYSDVEKLKALMALAANKGNATLTAEQTGIPYNTVLYWSRQTSTNLDDRLERLAHQLITVMPEKLNEADLQQITRALALVLNNIQRDSGADKRSDVYEKLARLMDRYAAGKRAIGDAEPSDGG